MPLLEGQQMEQITIDAVIENIQQQIKNNEALIQKLQGSIEILKSLQSQGYTHVSKPVEQKISE